MWRRVEIENFRAFERFELDDLGRVNLLVGENNSGKTTVLEALDLLASGGNPHHLWDALARRGESPDDGIMDGAAGEVDVTHLFHGHEPGALQISVQGDEGRSILRAELSLSRPRPPPFVEGPPEPFVLGARPPPEGWDSPRRNFMRSAAPAGTLQLSFESESSPGMRLSLHVGPGGRLEPESAHQADTWEYPATTAQLLTTRSLNADLAAQLFGQIALEDDESSVLEALRSIEPGVQRIALISVPPFARERGGLAVRLADVPRRVPIGSLGDGIWRLLVLTLCLMRAKGGVLLVDEIDTGLHYSVLSKMWALLMKTAERLDVQVFATTHSRDCYESLAAICREDAQGLSRVSIQRIERGKHKAVAFTEREIVLAAERGIEVR